MAVMESSKSTASSAKDPRLVQRDSKNSRCANSRWITFGVFMVV